MKLLPWFTQKYQSKLTSALELTGWMADDPDLTCVCLVMDGDDIRGVSIAYATDDGSAFIWEAHSGREVPREVIDEVLQMMIDWAKSMGFKKITGKPNRAAKLWVRRWGFTIIETDGITEIYKEI
jgi:hypothetical protein